MASRNRRLSPINQMLLLYIESFSLLTFSGIFAKMKMAERIISDKALKQENTGGKRVLKKTKFEEPMLHVSSLESEEVTLTLSGWAPDSDDSEFG